MTRQAKKKRRSEGKRKSEWMSREDLKREKKKKEK